MKRIALTICLLVCSVAAADLVLVLVRKSPELAENSLRPDVFPSIPAEVTAAGYAPNDLSTSVRTDVEGTERAGVINITAGTYTEPYVASTTDRTYELQGNVTFDGAGIQVTANNVTIDLNGYTLIYKNVAPENVEIGTVVSSGSSPLTINPSGLSLSVNSHFTYVIEFLDGDEAGNFYEVLDNDATTLTVQNHTTAVSSDWENGGPSADDTFRIYNARATYGVGGANLSGIEIINGSITEGAGYGRGSSIRNGQGCNPIWMSGSAVYVGGVNCTHADENELTILTGENSTVEYCEINDNGTVVTNRQAIINAIDLNNGGTARYNLIVNHRYIAIGTYDDCTVEYNEIFGQTRGTNAYGVGTYSGEGNTYRYNNIYKTGEHPIGIGLHSDGCQDNEVNNNWIECQTTAGSAEYGYNNAVGISDRWGERTAENYVHDNAFIVYAEEFDEGSEGESLGRCLFIGKTEAGNFFSERFEDNLFAAIGRDDATECHVLGIALHDDLVVRNNTLIGSHNIFWLSDSYGPATTGGRFINNSVQKVGSDPNFATFFVWDYLTTDVDFISNTYGEGTGQEDADFSGSWDAGTVINFGYNITVTVTSGGEPVEGATVSIDDKDTNTLRSGYVTDANGQVVVDCPTYYRSTDGTTTTTLAPLTVNAVNGMESGSDTISPSSDDSITVTIE